MAEKRPNSSTEKISDRTLSRMRWYLFALDEFAKQEKTVTSSQEIAEKVGINSGLVRKDLCNFGGFGRPSVGYNIAYLQKKIRDILQINRVRKVAWVGARAMEGNPYLVKRFIDNKCEILALFDHREEKTGTRVGDYEVLPYEEIERVVVEKEIDSAVIAALDDNAAQRATDLLSKAGVKSILNLSPAVVVAPKGVTVRNIDLVSELITLSYNTPEE